MNTIEASEFRAKCLALMDYVNETGDEILITKNGIPVSKLSPVVNKPKTLFSPHFSPVGEMIARGFEFTRGFLKKWNNRVYFRLRKIPCGFKEQARARQLVRNAG